MAFLQKYTPTADERCPVCRQPYKDGRKLTVSAYDGEMGICRRCSKQFYKQAADLESPSNLLVQLRPADIRERGVFLKREEPEGGYEFRMPQILAELQIRGFVMWLLLFVIAELLLRGSAALFDCNVQNLFTWRILHLVWMVTAVVNSIRYALLLVRGIARGMGHFRRIILLAEIAVSVLVLVLLLP